MSKTIKVIDLVNKIVNKEQIPRKIKFYDCIYEYHENSKNYYNVDNYEETLFDDGFLIIANDEVEIIEEEPEIDIQKIEDVKKIEDEMTVGYDFTNVGDKINELIKAIKQLDKQIKEK